MTKGDYLKKGHVTQRFILGYKGRYASMQGSSRILYVRFSSGQHARGHEKRRLRRQLVAISLSGSNLSTGCLSGAETPAVRETDGADGGWCNYLINIMPFSKGR